MKASDKKEIKNQWDKLHEKFTKAWEEKIKQVQTKAKIGIQSSHQ